MQKWKTMCGCMCGLWLALVGCQREPGQGYTLTGATVLIAAADFAGANFLYSLELDLEGQFAGALNQTDLGADPRLDPALPSKANCGGVWPFVVRREAWGANLGSVAALRPGAGYPIDHVFQVNDGANPANPQDIILLAPDRAYVSRFEPPYNVILVVNPQTGAFLGNIDLSPLADQLPRPTRMLRWDGLVLVLLQDFSTGWPATFSNGKIAVIDPGSDTVANVIALALVNPSGLALIPERNRLAVSAAGDWSDPDLTPAGVELVDLASQTSLGVVMTGAAVNGRITDVAGIGQGRAALISYRADFSANDVFALELDSAQLSPALYTTAYAPDLEACGTAALLVADATNSQVVALDLDDLQVMATLPLDTPPVAVSCW